MAGAGSGSRRPGWPIARFRLYEAVAGRLTLEPAEIRRLARVLGEAGESSEASP